MKLSKEEIAKFSPLYRNHLVNSLSGFKSANLIGTVDQNGQYNLAVFSSVIHLGSDPALLGFITRPHSVPRHTYENIKSSGFYTINHIHNDIIEAAHQTSAKYGPEVDEFEAVGLTREFSKDHPVPYVKESHVKIGLALEEEHFIQANETILVVGKVLEVHFQDDLLQEDGYLDLSSGDTVTINGLDGYLVPSQLKRMAYARPFEPVKPLEDHAK